MKFKRILALLSILAIAVIDTGCRSLNPQTGQKEFDPVKTEQVKAALEPVVSGGVRRVITNNKKHGDEVAAYLRSVGRVFCKMETNGNFSVEFLVSEVDGIVAPQIGDSYVLDIKNAVVALYRINYADRFKAELPPDKWPAQVASLFCGAIDRGLKDAGKPGVK